MKKQIKFFLTISAMVFLLLGCSKKNSDEAKTESTDNTSKIIVLKIGHVEPEDRSTQKALLEFKKNVETRTNNSIKIEIYPNAALGGDVQLTESVAMGTLDMALPATSVLTAYSKKFGILDMPYLFTSSTSAFKAMDGDIGEYLNNELITHGMINLGYSYNGPRSITSNLRAIEKPEDLKGIKMRVMESPIFIDFFKTLNANPTPMSFSELYTGLQQGTVEAQENPPSLIWANKFYEVQKYLSITEHVHNFLAFLINPNKFESLSTDQQLIIREEANNFIIKQREIELTDNEACIKKLGNEGKLSVNILTQDQKNIIKEALRSMYDKYNKEFGEDLFNMAEKYNK